MSIVGWEKNQNLTSEGGEGGEERLFGTQK